MPEEDETTRLIRRQKSPPPLPGAEQGLNQPTRVIEPEESEGEMTRLVGPARRGAAEPVSTTPSPDGGEADPVVGWLVVLAGPGRGNARRLGYGQNSIGRDRGERICLDFGDGSISRAKHAFIIYEPRKREYLIRPGDGANLTYLNGELLAEPRPLSPTDTIELGATRLKFVPLCGPEFDWEEAAKSAPAP